MHVVYFYLTTPVRFWDLISLTCEYFHFILAHSLMMAMLYSPNILPFCAVHKQFRLDWKYCTFDWLYWERERDEFAYNKLKQIPENLHSLKHRCENLKCRMLWVPHFRRKPSWRYCPQLWKTALNMLTTQPRGSRTMGVLNPIQIKLNNKFLNNSVKNVFSFPLPPTKLWITVNVR